MIDMFSMSIEEIISELDLLKAKKRKLVKEIDDYDTQIIGLKEQLRKFEEKKKNS